MGNKNAERMTNHINALRFNFANSQIISLSNLSERIWLDIRIVFPDHYKDHG